MKAVLLAILVLMLMIPALAHEGEDEHFWDSPEARREMIIQTGVIVGVGVVAGGYLLIRRRIGR